MKNNNFLETTLYRLSKFTKNLQFKSQNRKKNTLIKYENFLGAYLLFTIDFNFFIEFHYFCSLFKISVL